MQPGIASAFLEDPIDPLKQIVLPILIIANDRSYMGSHTNGRALNAVASIYLVILMIVAVAAIPLIIITKGGA